MVVDKRNPDDMFDFHEKLTAIVGAVASQTRKKEEIYELLMATIVFFYFENEPAPASDKAFIEVFSALLKRGIYNMRLIRSKSGS